MKFAPFETACLQGTDSGTKGTPSRLVRHLAFPVVRRLSSRQVTDAPSTRMNRTPSPSRFRRTRRPEEPCSVDYLPSCAESPETTDSVYRCPLLRWPRAWAELFLEHASRASVRKGSASPRPRTLPANEAAAAASLWASVLSPTARGSNCGE
ncbi:hypothetical protein IscW_ISCW014277 [Ixodes scapularis]|uniref:Uncharacterized protein n=1 Tax=Ixodes scapularis TaxID=6945 RepID=B7QKU7_IXOSC|nr:hypothetical protein IscW_ISCW014277 [Ixodes scapularis]|eukprot:XP_002415802.1 hypothetical protein IscW_ISCW014277 [Ixodes scapularis]